MAHYYFCLIVLIFGSMSNIHPDFHWRSWVPWVSPAKQEHQSQEFEGIDSLGVYVEKGHVTIKAWDQPTVYVEYTKKGTQEVLDRMQVDIKRKHGKHLDFEVENEKGALACTIMVPKTCDIIVSMDAGDLVVQEVAGEVKASVEVGTVKIVAPGGDVSVKNEAGKIVIERSAQVTNACMSINSEKGKITLCTTEEISARLLAKSDLRPIISEVPVLLDSKKMKLGKQSWKEYQRNVQGYIGSEKTKNTIQLITQRGKITITPFIA